MPGVHEEFAWTVSLRAAGTPTSPAREPETTTAEMPEQYRKRTAPEQGPRGPEDRELISALRVTLAGLKIRPRAGVHVAEQRRLPRVFRMRREERFGVEVSAAGMTHARDETHAFRHFAVGSFALHRSSGVVRTPFPHSYSARRGIAMAAEHALIVGLLLFKGVKMIAEHFLREIDVNLPAILLHQLVPTEAAGVGRGLRVFRVERGCVEAQDFRIPRPVGAGEVAVLGPPEFGFFQAELELGNLAGLAVAEQPVVGIAAVVAVEHDFRVVVNRPGILQRLARADKFRFAVGVPALELRDGRLGNHQPAGIDAEVVVAGDYAGKAVHQDAITVRGSNVEHDAPALTVQVAGPIIVRDDDLMVLRPASRGHERAAVARADKLRRPRHLVALVVPGHVITGQLLEGVEGHNIVHIKRAAAGAQAVHNALQFLLIFGINFRPEHVVRGFAEEIPIALGGMRYAELHGRKGAFD